jgi:hypothetical protein
MAVRRRIGEFDSELIFPMAVRGVGTHTEQMLIEGNSYLCSVFVRSIDVGATLQVNHWEFTTAVGAEAGERYDLLAHPLIVSAPFLDRKSVTKIHNKPQIECIVTGGNVEFQVFITVVSSFTSDLDNALIFNEQIADLLRNKGMPVAGYDPVDNKFHFVKVASDGSMSVVFPEALQVTFLEITKRLSDVRSGVNPNIPTTVLSYTVPAGKKFTWLGGKSSSDCLCKWSVIIDGVQWIFARNSFDAPDCLLYLGSPHIINAGETLEVIATNRSPIGTLSSIETFIYGNEESI